MSAISSGRRSQALVERLALVGVVIVAIGVLVGVLLVPTAVVASDTLDFVAGDLLDVGPLPDAEPPPQNSYIYASDGSLLAEINFNENREPATLEEIPDIVEQAVIATEDSEFREHHGINPQAILRAGLSNLEAGGIESGASTITQQYVKNTFLQDRATEQTLDRKIVEAVWAVELEKRLSKDEILERYLNRIYFGAGAYGVAAAADRYFSVSMKDLTLPQAATLAGVIRDPSGNDPLDNPEAAESRRNIVLDQMARGGYITEQQRDVAQATPLETNPSQTPPPNEPFWVDWITQQLTSEGVAEALGQGATEPMQLMGETQEDRIAQVFQGGLRIHTTLNPEWQQQATDAIIARLTAEDESDAELAQEPIGGIVSIEPGSGAVRTMALGPRRYGSCTEDDEWAGTSDAGELLCAKTKFNPLPPGAGSGRQPGSAFKPLVVTAALEAGIPPGWTTDARSGQVLEGCGQEEYAPSNAGGDGFRDMYDGIKYSVNVFAAKLAREVGPPAVEDLAGRLGLRHWAERADVGAVDCSIGLGATDVSPLEMASAYATLANRGEYCAPYAIERIEGPTGDLIYEHSTDCTREVSTDVVDRVVDIMHGPVTPGGTADDMQARMQPYPVRGKTGTTNDSRDAWFVGYVQQLATAAWIGYPNGASTYETVDQAAAQCPRYHDGEPDPDDYGDGVATCPPTTRLMQDVQIGGQYYENVYGATIPAPMWGDYMTGAVQAFEPESFPDPGPLAGTRVPNLVAAGTVAQARSLADDAGLNFATRSVTDHRPEGTIVGQSPSAGDRVTVGSIVFLQISDGEGTIPTVPDVVGLSEDEAVASLERAGYRVDVLRRPTRTPDEVGIVLAQTPTPGEQVPPRDGATVVLEVGELDEGPPDGGGDDDGGPGNGNGGDDDGPGNGNGGDGDGPGNGGGNGNGGGDDG